MSANDSKRAAEGIVMRIGGPLFVLRVGEGAGAQLIACDLLDGWLEGRRARVTVEAVDAQATSPKRRTHRGTVNISRDTMGNVVDVYLDTPIGIVSVLEPFMSFGGKRVELTVRLIDEDGGGNG